MASYNMMTTDGINSFINDWQTNQTKKKVDPLTTKQKSYNDIENAYQSIGDKLGALKSSVYALQQTGTSSAFLVKKASSSDATFADITATSAAQLSSQSIRINQLAKNDLVISQDLTSTTDNSTIIAAGTHTFEVTAGDGKGGVIKSNIDVTFDVADFTNGHISNQDVIKKIQAAVNEDKAVVLSNSVTGSTASAGSFNLNLNGTATQITYTAGTYSDTLDSIISQINKVNGVNAEKVIVGSDFQLKITVTDSSKYMSLSGDTSALLSELNINSDQVMGGSGLLTASTFSPTSDLSQLSVSAKKSGYDFRLMSLQDTSGQALTSVGLNLGATRQTFAQVEGGADTPGFVYDPSLLNAKIEFNGINVQRNSNSISDLVTGATINLKSLMQPTDTTVNLSVASDSASVIDKVQDFVKKFDDIYVFLKQKTISNKDGRGLLVGDSTANSLLDLFTTVSTSSVSGINTNDLRSLSQLGISFDTANGLSVDDSAKLEKAIKETPDQVEAIFNSTNGVAKNLYSRIDPYINATGYLFKSKSNFDITLSYLDDKIKSTQDNIAKQASDLRLNYMKTMSRMNALINNQSLFIMGNNTVG